MNANDADVNPGGPDRNDLGPEPTPWLAGPPPPPPGTGPDGPTVQMPPSRGAGSNRPAGGGPGGPAWWHGGPAGGWSSRAGAVVSDFQSESLWFVAAASILTAYAVAWVAALLAAVRHQPGLTAQARALELFGPGSVEWAVFVLIGVALVAAGRRFELHGSRLDRTADVLLTGLLIAAAVVAAAAVFGVIVELADLGHGIDAAFTGIVDRLAVLPVAGAAGWWAWQAREELKPVSAGS